MNRYLTLLVIAAVCAFSSVASANQEFWTAISEKRYDDALQILEADETVDVNWIPRPGAFKSASMVGVPGDEHRPLLTAIWRKMNGGRKNQFTSETMQAHIVPGMGDAAKAMFTTGFESDETGMRFLHWVGYEGDTVLMEYYVDKLDDKSLLNTAVDVVNDVILHSVVFGENDLSEGKAPFHRRIVKYLVKQGAQVDARGEYRKTPLILAAELGLARMVHTLLELGADVNAVDDSGESALLRAARNGHERVVSILLEEGANPNATSIAGALPLLEAVANKHHKVAALLLGKGANARGADARGNSALHLVQEGHAKTAQLLLDAGADINAANADGERPLHCAIARGASLVHALLSKNPMIDAADGRGDTPLHVAARRNHEPLVRLLVRSRATVDAANLEGETPADVTTKQGLKTFLEKKTGRNSNNSSPKKRERSPGEAEEVVQVDREGEAIKRGRQDVVEVVDAVAEMQPVAAAPALAVEQMLQEIGDTLGDNALYALLVGLRYGKQFK